MSFTTGMARAAAFWSVCPARRRISTRTAANPASAARCSSSAAYTSLGMASSALITKMARWPTVVSPGAVVLAFVLG